MGAEKKTETGRQTEGVQQRHRDRDRYREGNNTAQHITQMLSIYDTLIVRNQQHVASQESRLFQSGEWSLTFHVLLLHYDAFLLQI